MLPAAGGHSIALIGNKGGPRNEITIRGMLKQWQEKK